MSSLLPAAAQLLQLSAARALAQKAEKKGDKPLSVALRGAQVELFSKP
jgi:hypothetical protein